MAPRKILRSKWIKYLLLALMIGGTALSLHVWRQERATHMAMLHIDFSRLADAAENRLRQRIASYESLLRAGQAFMRHSETVSELEWHRFAASLEIDDKYRGIDGYAFITRVPEERLKKFESGIGRKVHPSSAAPGERYVMTFLHPPERARNAVGFDLGSDEERRKALEAARDGGKMAATPPLVLVTAKASQRDFILFLPVYRPGETLATVEERRDALTGWVGGGYNAGSVMADLFPSTDPDIRVAVHDGPENRPESLLNPENGMVERTSFEKRSSISVGGRNWTMLIRATPQFAVRSISGEYGILLGGLALTAALCLSLWQLARERSAAEELAIERGKDLLVSRAYHQAVVEALGEGVVVQDNLGRIVDCNPAAEKILGFSFDRLEGVTSFDPLWITIKEDGEPLPASEHPAMVSLETGDTCSGVIMGVKRGDDGAVAWISVNTGLIRDPESGGIRAVVSSFIDIGEMKRKEALLRGTNAELEQFAYVASHDLREPLRMVNTYVALLDRRLRHRLAPEEMEFLQFASEGATRMDRLIRDLLDYSRVGKFCKPMEGQGLDIPLEDALTVLKPEAEEAGAEMVVEGRMPWAVISADEITRLFKHLIGNAIKYRRDGIPPRIVISAAEMEDKWRITVADNGIGIAPEQQSRIFRMFQRLHARSEYGGGTGIGLAVCKKIVERHGGHIWMESEGEGMGSRFIFTLPKEFEPMESETRQKAGWAHIPVIAALFLAAAPALAEEGTLAIRQLTPESALNAAKAALDECRRDGHQVTVALVDRAGIPQVVLRDRLAGPHTPEAAIRKAWTAASFRAPTGEMAEATESGKPMSGLRHLPNVLMVAGGLPVIARGAVAGGIGVSGAPGGARDEICAWAGLSAIALEID